MGKEFLTNYTLEDLKKGWDENNKSNDTSVMSLASSIYDDSEEDKNISYKYAEDRIISDFKSYIDNTYGQHYKSDLKSVECFDAWIALGEATPTFRNTALKYLWRYGKKNGNNKDDLMKTLHYTLMCLYNDHYKKDVK